MLISLGLAVTLGMCFGIIKPAEGDDTAAIAHEDEAPAREPVNQRHVPDAPNVLFIAVDDLNDELSGLGRQAYTPNIDRLAERGVNFANHHVVAGVCAPSRTAMLTGLHPANSGWYLHHIYFHESQAPNLVSLPQAFKDAGYLTLGAGKVFHHTRGFVDLKAFDEFFVWQEDLKARGWPVGSWDEPAPLPPGGQGGHSDIAQYTGWDQFDFWEMPNELESEMTDTIFAKWAADIVRNAHKERFFVAVGLYAPHKPNYVPQRYYDLYPLEEIKVPPVGYRNDDLDNLPPRVQQQRQRRASRVHNRIVENDDWARVIQGYLAAASYADAQIGRILDALDEGPNADNTIVVVWSDHGYHLGEKDHHGKHTLWSRTTRCPLIWAGPGIPEGVVYDGVVSTLDLYPTLIAMTGLTPPHELDGESLTPIFESPDLTQNRAVSTVQSPDAWTVVTNQWRYIHHPDGEELYDQQADPYEWNNLAGKSQFQDIVTDLRQRYPYMNDPAPITNWRDRYRLVTEGESFYWEERGQD